MPADHASQLTISKSCFKIYIFFSRNTYFFYQSDIGPANQPIESVNILCIISNLSMRTSTFFYVERN